jgi:hypothetical protein
MTSIIKTSSPSDVILELYFIKNGLIVKQMLVCNHRVS